MTNCKTCNTFQPRLRKGGLCDTCSGKGPSQDGMNNYFEASIFGSNMQSRGPPPPQSLNHLTALSQQQQQEQFLNQNLLHQQQQQQQSNGMSTNSQNTPLQASSPIGHSVMQNTSIQHRFGPPQQQPTMQGGMVNPNPTPPDPAMQELMSKTPGELSAADFFQICQMANKEIHTKIDDLSKFCNKEFTSMKNTIKILEDDKKKKDEEIQTLKYTIVGMQRSLNMIDSDGRDKNAVIYGVPENEINNLVNDEEKIKHILGLINCPIFDGDAFNQLTIERIGKPRENYNRVIKIKCGSKENRNELTKNSNKLKEADETWKRVYIRKDEHPVYLAEKNRLRKKMLELKKVEENKTKEIIIKDGKLLMNGVVVDKNTFFA